VRFLKNVAGRPVVLYWRSDKHVEVRSDGLKDRGSTPLASKCLYCKDLRIYCPNTDNIMANVFEDI
jgi:hypothetical protein